MICALAGAHKRIGVTANSHKVIRNVLDAAIKAAAETGVAVNCIQKVTDKQDDVPHLTFTTDNAVLLAAIGTSCQVAAGTAWLWARQDAFEGLSMYYSSMKQPRCLWPMFWRYHRPPKYCAVGASWQLEQPMQGSHPDGTEVSALDHILGIHVTIPTDRGLFLEETWRLHPEICSFTSELFYEGRLRSRPGLELQNVKASGRIKGAGLRFLPVVHEGNQSVSVEEADAIRLLVKEILDLNPTGRSHRAGKRCHT